MKKTTTLVITSLFCFQSAAFAAPQSKTKGTAGNNQNSSIPSTQPTASTTHPESTQPSRSSSVGSTRFSASGPITLIDGSMYYGAYLTLLHEISPNLMIGGETGFAYRSETVSGVSASSWDIPILPTALYYFDMPQTPTFAPMIGIGLGVGVLHATVTLGAQSASATEAKFQGTLHLGAAFGEGRNFFVDLRPGILDSFFVFAPTIGYTF